MRADLPDRLEALIRRREQITDEGDTPPVGHGTLRECLDALRALRDAPVATVLALPDSWELFNTAPQGVEVLDALDMKQVRLVVVGEEW